MTTIVYRDGVLCADSLVSAGEARCGHLRKIAQAPDGTMGGSGGYMSDMALFLAWIESGMEDDPPSFEDNFDGLLILPDGRSCFVGKHAKPVPFEAPFAAVGSGERFAMGAMEMGADARRAVEVAIKYDCGSGGEIHELRLRG